MFHFHTPNSSVSFICSCARVSVFPFLLFHFIFFLNLHQIITSSCIILSTGTIHTLFRYVNNPSGKPTRPPGVQFITVLFLVSFLKVFMFHFYIPNLLTWSYISSLKTAAESDSQRAHRAGLCRGGSFLAADIPDQPDRLSVLLQRRAAASGSQFAAPAAGSARSAAARADTGRG